MMKQINQIVRQWPLTIAVTCSAVLIGLSESLASRLDIQLHSQFGIIQLFSCHLTHWSWEHLLWDLGMFTVLGVVCERDARRAFYMTLLSSALLIPLALMLSNPEIDGYRGLSGIDTSVFALFASIALLRGCSDRDRFTMAVFGIMLGLLWCKIGFEFWSGGVLFVKQLNFEPLPMAHAVGAVVGSIVAVAVGQAVSRVGQAVSPDHSRDPGKVREFCFASVERPTSGQHV